MFIEQINTKKFNFLLYLPISLGFIALIGINYYSSIDVDQEALIKEMIRTLGYNLTFVSMVFPLSFACLLLLLWVKLVHKQSITSLTTSRKKVDWKRIFFAFGLWSSITIGITLAQYYISPENYVVNFDLIPFLIFLGIAVLLLPLQTSFEEYLFRGYMMQGIGVATRSRLVPLLFTSFLFGIMHIANPEIGKMGLILLVYYIITGFFLGIMTLMDDGLELSLGFHAANNLIGVLLVTSDWSALQTASILKDVSEPNAVFDVIFPLIIIYPVLLFIFSKKYNWTDWKMKLTGKITTLKHVNDFKSV